MNLKQLFAKPVDRPIEGVIKADDEAQLRLEIEEYVLTREVSKRLELFLDAYRNYNGANGVWISGFFGSGKSHMLKLLALLLENRRIDGASALDLFLPKCSDTIMAADLKHAAAVPSKSILFNIDQKADVISKADTDALLSVFMKVFNETCGYYGKQSYIAQFERELDGRGIYDKFKESFKAASGLDWEKGREQALMESANIAKAYAAAAGANESEAKGILEKYRAQHKVSIEDFAELVKLYIDSKPAGFRLNFFVDEVGQYIAENIKLMTNLQTIAESLATKCRGRSWIIVTAQEDMDTVVGEMNKNQSNDFSKIQARFATRLKLTSADVDEVIQRRLLEKNDEGVTVFSDLYHKHSNNFKTFFDFSDGSQTYRNFRDRDHFIECSPFTPYQFRLFQASIQSLSEHNAFEGRHSSVGERSMLGVFQQVAILIGGHEPGQIATFDLMFEGIRTSLKSNVQSSIIKAESQLNDKFAIKLLKSLFLVKYIRAFKASARNLCILAFDGFERDLPRLKKEVEEALALLEQQTYIQRNGDYFEFLTNEEQDIEAEIKNVSVETVELNAELEKLIFEHVIKDRKIKFKDNGQDFAYSRKIDDKLQGREYELAVNVITPFKTDDDREEAFRMQSNFRDEMVVIMPLDARLAMDLSMYKRTEKYIKQNFSSAQQDTVRAILSEKGARNNDRYKEVQRLVKESLAEAKIIIGGAEVKTSGTDPQTRIVEGFGELISRVYPNLKMHGNAVYTENDINKLFKESRADMFQTTAQSLAEPEQEALAFIHTSSQRGVRTTLKAFIEKFDKKPYGWHYLASLHALANLYLFGKLEIRSGGSVIENEEVRQAFFNSTGYTNVVIDPQIEFTSAQVRALKNFYNDFFDVPPASGEAKSLAKETGEAFKKYAGELELLMARGAQFNFLNSLAPVVELLKSVCGNSYTWYLTDLSKQADTLLELKEKVSAPIIRFMSGPHKNIYESAQNFLREQEPNFLNIEGDDAKQADEILKDPLCYRGNGMQKLKTIVDGLQHKINDKIRYEISCAAARIDELKSEISTKPEFINADKNKASAILKTFDDFKNSLERHKLIAVIRDTLRRFEETEYAKIVRELAPALPITPPVVKPDPGSGPGIISKKEIPLNALRIGFDQKTIASKEDANKYIKALEKAIGAEIDSGKTIII
jgi:hypothetical protein